MVIFQINPFFPVVFENKYITNIRVLSVNFRLQKSTKSFPWNLNAVFLVPDV